LGLYFFRNAFRLNSKTALTILILAKTIRRSWAAVKPPPASEGVSFGLNLLDRQKVEKEKRKKERAEAGGTPLPVLFNQ
jgi:hypothetical protein